MKRILTLMVAILLATMSGNVYAQACRFSLTLQINRILC